ncbi:MAG TPA: DNA-binding domain-containing protein [Magnetovibrio sp.]
MLALAELQSRIRDTVLGGDGAHLQGVVANDRLGYERRLNVYRNNTTLLLHDALATQFPVTAQLVGDEFFAHLAKAFLRIHPPQSPCLFEYGDGFADFIETFPGAQTLPYLADVARLEWARVCAVHATDTPMLIPAALSTVAAEDYGRLTFTPLPASSIITSPFPIHAIWALHLADADPQATIHLDAGFEAVLVTRPGIEVQTALLEPGEAFFMTQLFSGVSVTEAFTRAQEQNDDFDLAHALSTVLTSGAFSAYVIL